MTFEERKAKEEEALQVKAESDWNNWQADLKLLENITINEVNVTMRLSLTKLYKSYCIFNISNKMDVRKSHRKAALILAQDPSVLAVEFLMNQIEYGSQASIDEMNEHKRKVVKQDPDYDGVALHKA